LILKENPVFTYYNESKNEKIRGFQGPSLVGRIFNFKNPKVYGVFKFGHFFCPFFKNENTFAFFKLMCDHN
jgi:hypothetical protein